MNEILSDEEISHPLNEKLLGEAEEIKAERRTLKERIERLEQTRDAVSAAVHQKVRADYTSRMSKTTERLIALKRNLEAEERRLVEKKMQVEANIKLHREKIEESSLRHTLGEFAAEEHQALTEREQKEIERLEGALKALAGGLTRHREIFEGESLAEPVRETPPVRATAEARPTPSTPRSGVAAEVHAQSPAESTAKIRMGQTEHEAEVSGSTERSASAAAPKRFSELHVLEGNKVVQTLTLDRTIQIGRSPANDVVLKEPKVSRKHAEIQFVGGRYVLLDLESSNGTFVGGKKITEQVLQPNDEIMIGNTKMVFKG